MNGIATVEYTWRGVLRWLLTQTQEPTITRLETIMAKQNEILTDLGSIKTNQAEIKGDLLEVKDIAASQTTKISDLELQIAELKSQLDPAAFDAIAAAVADIKADSRAIADIVAEPEPPPAA